MGNSFFNYIFAIAVIAVFLGIYFFYNTFFVSEEAVLRAYQKSLDKGFIKEKYRHTFRYYFFIYFFWIGAFSFSFFLLENLFYDLGGNSFLIFPLSVLNTGNLFIDNLLYKKALQRALPTTQ